MQKLFQLTTINNKYINQSAGVQLNLLSKKGWFIQNDLSNQTYSGLVQDLTKAFGYGMQQLVKNS